jgi:hypothetical protein
MEMAKIVQLLARIIRIPAKITLPVNVTIADDIPGVMR